MVSFKATLLKSCVFTDLVGKKHVVPKGAEVIIRRYPAGSVYSTGKGVICKQGKNLEIADYKGTEMDIAHGEYKTID